MIMLNADLLYFIINAAVLPAWALLIFAPRWSVTHKVVHSVLYPVLFGIFYLILMIYMASANPEGSGGSFTSIEGVQSLFSHPLGLVIGWAHYLVFDLFIGAWIARDGLRRGIKHVFIVPCILLSFIVGPIGLLLYVIVRKFIKKGGVSLSEI